MKVNFKQSSGGVLTLFVVFASVVIALFGCERSKPGSQSSSQIELVNPTEETSQSDNMLRLAGRSYIASVLKEIFGPQSYPIVQTLIESNILAIGGEACQPYQNDCEDGENIAGWSPYGDSGLPSVPRATTLRAALISRTCDRIAANDDAIRFAVALVLNGNINPLIPPSKIDIQSAFNEFRPGRSLDSESILQLSNVVQEAGKTGSLDAWRFLFLTLCLDPSWQIL